MNLVLILFVPTHIANIQGYGQFRSCFMLNISLSFMLSMNSKSSISVVKTKQAIYSLTVVWDWNQWIMFSALGKGNITT